MRDEQNKDDGLTPSQPQSLARRSAALVRRGLAEALTLQSSEAHYDRGVAKYDNGHYDDAIHEFTRAIELNPKYAEAYHDRGLAKAKKLDYDGSIDDFTKAIEISPPFPVAYTNRGLAEYYRGDLERAMNDYTKAIEVSPRHADAYLNRGRAKIDGGDYGGAIDDFSKAVEIDSQLLGSDPFDLIDDIVIHSSDVYGAIKPKFEEWAKEMRKEFGGKAEPHLQNIYALVGLRSSGIVRFPKDRSVGLLYTYDSIDDRLKFLRRVNGLDVYLDLKTGKEVFIGRPNIEGESEPAISTRLETICHEVLEIDAKMQPLLTIRDEQALAPLFDRLNRELLPAIQQIVRGAGRHLAFAHFTFGLILRLLHKREEAERAFRKANEIQPGVINTLRELVRCLGEQDKHREALPFAREAVSVGPMDAGAWGNLAMCLISCGEREEAREAIDHAIKLDPQDSINRYIWDNFEGYFLKG